MTDDNEWINGKKIGFIRDLFKDLGIKSFDQLRTEIAGKDAIGKTCKFKICRHNELQLDDENRSFKEDFSFKRTIFDCDEVVLANSTTVDLVDCIFLGSLYVGRKQDSPATLTLDNCIFENTLQYGVVGAKAEAISLTDVAAQELCLLNFETEKVRLSSCSFSLARFERVKVATLHIFNSQFGAFEKNDSFFENVIFPPGTVDSRKIGKPGFLAMKIAKMRPYNFLGYYLKKVDFDSLIDGVVDHEKSRMHIETIEFLLASTSLRNNKREAAQLKYNKALEESRSWLSRSFTIVTGGFLKPMRILILSAVIISVFAGIYVHLGPVFGPGTPISLSIIDAIYFSGVTFTTLGYGDIVPLESARLCTVVEAFFGILLSSGFVASVIRRYVE